MPGAGFFGLGGVKMADAGLERVVRAEDVAHMGITEVIRHMPSVFARYKQLVRAIKEQRPAAAVLIDFPDVNFRLARELKKLGVPVVYFVSPQLWAWKRRRLRWVQERVDRMMVIFPFEENFYRARGVEVEFVGHPLAEAAGVSGSREEYATQSESIHQRQSDHVDPLAMWSSSWPLDPTKQWVALLPGSRSGEIKANLLEMIETALLLGNSYEYLIPVAPTVSDELLEEMQAQTGKQLSRLDWENLPRITFVKDARSALFYARASVVASGTATVLAAVAGNPFVVVYRVSDMTYRVAKRLVRYPAEIPAQVDEVGNLPVGMVNLIAGRRVVPELLQERFTAGNVAAALRPLLEDGPERSRMIADLAEVRAKLLPEAGSQGRRTAIQRVADVVEGLLAGVS